MSAKPLTAMQRFMHFILQPSSAIFFYGLGTVLFVLWLALALWLSGLFASEYREIPDLGAALPAENWPAGNEANQDGLRAVLLSRLSLISNNATLIKNKSVNPIIPLEPDVRPEVAGEAENAAAAEKERDPKNRDQTSSKPAEDSAQQWAWTDKHGCGLSGWKTSEDTAMIALLVRHGTFACNALDRRVAAMPLVAGLGYWFGFLGTLALIGVTGWILFILLRVYFQTAPAYRFLYGSHLDPNAGR